MKQTSFWQSVKSSRFLIKLKSWEYWPMHLIYSPIYLYWLFLSMRARAFFFFSGANPGIYLGGIFMESKMDILNKIPTKWIPETLFLPIGASSQEGLDWMIKKDLGFPIIAKPDKGERGFLVSIIQNREELIAYIQENEIDIILQEYIDYPMEVGVLYYRFPNQRHGTITSVTLKKFLSITGNGTSTVRELILDYPRAKLQLETLEETNPQIMDTIPSLGEEVRLVSIGNHCKGTTFLNGNHLIDQQMIDTFNEISHQIEGIYFGRFDIRCNSLEDLKRGENFMILEINGVKSEPTHIYEPGFSIWEAYKILFKQWTTIYRISMFNKSRGYEFPDSKEGFNTAREYFRYRKTGKLENEHAFSPQRRPELSSQL